MNDEVAAALADIDFEVRVEGRKTSEGDGRTAADIERERDEQEDPDGPG